MTPDRTEIEPRGGGAADLARIRQRAGRRSWPVLAVFACIVGLQLLVAIISIDLMSAVRAYVTGESLYSKGQKDAHIHLIGYAENHREEDYRRFLQALAVPIGDRVAREAMQKPGLDAETARRGLLEGGTHADDIPGVIRLFEWFHKTPLMADAIVTWTEGDALIEQVRLLAEKAQERVIAGDLRAAAVTALREDAQRYNNRLTELEIRFATQLADGARLSQRLLLGLNLVLAILLGLSGLAFVRHSARLQAATEDELRRRGESLHELAVARSTFLAKVSHELRSPLQGIVSALDVIEMRHSGAFEGNDELIGRMRRASMLLNRQLRDLLTLAKGEAGRLTMHPEPFEACALVEAMAEEARELALAKGLQLAVELPRGPLLVVADGARIDQVLTNLVVNSIRYTDVGQVRVSMRAHGRPTSSLNFVVSDTGPGIAESLLPTLFAPDKFVNSPARRGEGSGIGLAIVRTLVDQLGGRLEVTSRVGEGTSFTVVIPAVAVEPGDLEYADSDTPGRILIVDDRNDVLDALESVIDELGYEFDRASSAAAASRLLSERAYDAVLLDLDMPVKGGAELAADVRRGNGPNRAARFISVSAAERSANTSIHFDACLAKPIEHAALRTALLGARRGARPFQGGLWSDAT